MTVLDLAKLFLVPIAACLPLSRITKRPGLTMATLEILVGIGLAWASGDVKMLAPQNNIFTFMASFTIGYSWEEWKHPPP